MLLITWSLCVEYFRPADPPLAAGGRLALPGVGADGSLRGHGAAGTADHEEPQATGPAVVLSGLQPGSCGAFSVHVY